MTSDCFSPVSLSACLEVGLHLQAFFLIPVVRLYLHDLFSFDILSANEICEVFLVGEYS